MFYGYIRVYEGTWYELTNTNFRSGVICAAGKWRVVPGGITEVCNVFHKTWETVAKSQ